MPESSIPIRSVELSEVAERFEEIVAPVARGGTRVVIEQDGRPLAALVSTLDLEDLKKRDTERDERFKAMERLSEAFADVPVAELERQVELALQEARAELRAERESASRR